MNEHETFEKKFLKKLLSIGKDIAVLAGNLAAIVITVVVIFTIARFVFPVEGYTNGVKNEEEEVVVVTKSGVEANPVYELVGEEIEGTLNAYEPIDGELREGTVLDPYSKIASNPRRFWDWKDEEAVGTPDYIRYGFVDFNQIINLDTDDVLVFPDVNFGDVAPEYISMQIAKTDREGGVISVYVDSLEEKSLIAIFDVTEVTMGSGETDFFQVIEKIGRGKEITGVHKLYFMIEQEGLSIGQIRFGRAEADNA